MRTEMADRNGEVRRSAQRTLQTDRHSMRARWHPAAILGRRGPLFGTRGLVQYAPTAYFAVSVSDAIGMRADFTCDGLPGSVHAA